MQTKSNKLPLIILATYWNERYFIEPSLKQIEALNPTEIIICDGCFDPNVPNYSTDGTREIIQEFVDKHPNARLVSALRPGFLRSAWMLLRGHKHLPWWTMFRWARWKFLLTSFLRVSYRRNQAITFNHMISLSKEWKPGSWFMTYDADQFYSDEMIKEFTRTMSIDSIDVGLITGSEITFFKDFKHCTNDYEKRVSSNMPHRIFPDTLIQPTRSLIQETKSKGNFFDARDILARHLYTRFSKEVYVGKYFHYKFASRDRFDAGYKLGDRKKPVVEKYIMKEFTGEHPRVIREYFKL